MLFLFKDTATTKTYTLPLHDALPTSDPAMATADAAALAERQAAPAARGGAPYLVVEQVSKAFGTVLALERVSLTVADRKSTRLNSSHANISYAVFCLKKKSKPLQVS